MHTDEYTTKSKIITSTETGDSVEVLFGSKILANYKFPSYWEWQWDAPPDSITEDNKIQEKYFEMWKYYTYAKMQSLPTTSIPDIKNIEYLRIDYPYNLEDYISDSLDFKYRLDDIGPYQCYYSYVDNSLMEKPNSTIKPDTTTYVWNFEPMSLSSAGNIVLYNPVNKDAKIITTFFTAESSIKGQDRLFYIDKNKIIHIFISNNDETSRDFKEVYLIKVQQDGKVNIIKNK